MTTTLADLDEEQLLATVLPLMRSGPPSPLELLGPGDDAAVVAAASGSVVATTDTVVRDRDWRDEWCAAGDVGHKVVVQNLADIAAMGATPTGLLVALVADPATPLVWVRDLAAGIGQAARARQVPVVGGDLSSAGPGTLMIAVTALGDLAGGAPLTRSGARAGDILAVAGSLGRAAAGLLLLQRGTGRQDPESVSYHCRPQPPLEQGPRARDLGATSQIDISDGLLKDAGRVAAASGVCLELDRSALAADVARLAGPVTSEQAWECVLAGGEEHSLLATFPAGVELPEPWRVLGRVGAGSGVRLDGEAVTARGWDHFHR